ncbi:hypothetical protein D5072_03865 [Dickeya dianthicola]|uniref:Uncharacterized protein n=1 Tax=Dickeya dianthicola TaxID=204039 RepID=A0ABX9NNF1_9GAMM|nr:hypothetical protein D5072_03865 [Dickeya dianthicola]RJL73116.1 hypothetical protein D5077_10005 [Dickeya dianthicola]
MQVRWLSSLTPVTYLCKLLGIRCVAAFLQLELFWVYKMITDHNIVINKNTKNKSLTYVICMVILME